MAESEQHQFVAVYGKVTIRGMSFAAVGDELTARGFVMSRAERVDRGVIKIPHSSPRRQAATLSAMSLPVPEQPPEPDELAIRMQEEAERFLNQTNVNGLKVRQCGAVHTEGAVCLVPVLYEPLSCGCGDYVYHHEGPHEAVDEEGVKYRWTEILVVQDEPYDTYTIKAVGDDG